MNNTCIPNNDANFTFGLVAGYSGIPDNLVFNLIYFGACIIAFLLVRRHIRDQDMESRRHSIYQIVTDPRSITELNIKDLNPLTIIWKTLSLSLHEIGQKCGPDATRYLYFQMHLIFYSILLCVVSIVIILPINFQGVLNGNKSNFGFSTVANLPANSDYLWAPIIVNVFTTAAGIIIMFHFVYAGSVTSKDRTSKTTLMVHHVQRKLCNAEKIYQIMRVILPDVEIDDVTVAYNIWRLNRTIDRSGRIRALVKACDELEEEYGTAGPVYQCLCGYYFSRITCQRCTQIKQTDASQFYKGKLQEVEKTIDDMARESLSQPTGIVFITFSNEESASRALGTLQNTTPQRLRRFLSDHVHHDHEDLNYEESMAPLYVKRWHAHYAPKADNILWENVKERSWLWWFRLFALNCSLFWVALLLTTPSMLLNTIDKILSTTVEITSLNANVATFIVNILPPLLLKMSSHVLPEVIGYSSHLERHLTRSLKARSHIHKSFNFLLFTVLIIPSLGLTGINGFLRWLFSIDFGNGLDFQWQCIFLPDNGAFYVNFVITSAFFGTGTSLLRIPEFLALLFNVMLCRSRAEKRAIYKLQRPAFQFCSSYASLLTVFAVISAYSIICPLITLFGVLYFVLHFIVDKYNIYFVAAPTLVKQRIHLSAFKCAMTCLLMPQIFLVVFMGLKSVPLRNARFITQTIIASLFALLYILERPLRYHGFVGKAVSPMLDSVPLINATFEDERETLFKRYYPNYMLPYVGELTIAEHDGKQEPTEEQLQPSIDKE